MLGMVLVKVYDCFRIKFGCFFVEVCFVRFCFFFEVID